MRLNGRRQGAKGDKMTAKVYYQKFRKLAKRGSNEMLQRAVDEVFMAGFEAGMKSLSEHLKERLNDTNKPQQELFEGVPGMAQHETEMPEPQEPVS